jgi:hypothetical protein
MGNPDQKANTDVKLSLKLIAERGAVSATATAFSGVKESHCLPKRLVTQNVAL